MECTKCVRTNEASCKNESSSDICKYDYGDTKHEQTLGGRQKKSENFPAKVPTVGIPNHVKNGVL